MPDLERPLYPGPFRGDFTIAAFNPDREEVHVMRTPLEVDPPDLTLTAGEEKELRIGLGRVDMEIRWLGWLDDADTLRIWRSWTGFEIYRATFERRADLLCLTELFVESSPERYGAGDGVAHGQEFIETLNHCLSLIMLATNG